MEVRNMKQAGNPGYAPDTPHSTVRHNCPAEVR